MKCKFSQCEVPTKEVPHERDIYASSYDFAVKLTKIHRCTGGAFYHEYGVCLLCGNAFITGQKWQDRSAALHLFTHSILSVQSDGDSLNIEKWISDNIHVKINVTSLLSLLPQLVAISTKDLILRDFMTELVVKHSNSITQIITGTCFYYDSDNFHLAADGIIKNNNITWECLVCNMPYDAFPSRQIVDSHLEKCLNKIEFREGQ